MRGRLIISECDLEKDLKEILEIEKCFGKSGWTHQMFVRSHGKSDHKCLFVAKGRERNRDERYCAALIVMEDLEILRRAVRQAGRRQGVGSALILDTLRRGAVKGAKNAFLDVRNSNVDAHWWNFRTSASKSSPFINAICS